MGSGLQVFDTSGRVIFDSDLAMGGVCLEIVSIPPSSTDFTYPKAPIGRTPQVIFADVNFRIWTYDEVLGYPRFRFAASQGTRPNVAGIYIL